MLEFNAPWTKTDATIDGYLIFLDNSADFLFCVPKNQKTDNLFALLQNAPELYEAAKEMIDLKNKLWYQGLDEIEQGVFNSVLANLEITIEQIEKEADHGA